MIIMAVGELVQAAASVLLKLAAFQD